MNLGTHIGFHDGACSACSDNYGVCKQCSFHVNKQKQTKLPKAIHYVRDTYCVITS